MRTQRLTWLAILALTLLVACGDKNGDDDGTGDDDTLPIDANTTTPPDADTTTPDGTTAPDAAPNSVQCGAEPCDTATEQCCVEQGGATCIPSGDTCGGTSLTCDGPEDCPGDTDVCCVHVTGQDAEVSCAATCEQGDLVACNSDDDCADGEHCCGNPDGFQACLEVPQCPGQP